VCGPERVLAAEVEDAARSAADEVIIMHAGEDAENDIWAQASQIPGDQDQMHLLLVRSAQKLRHWDQFAGIIAARHDLSSTRLFFASDDDDFPYAVSGADRVLAPAVAMIRDSRMGLLVRCAMPGTDALVEWADVRLGSPGKLLADYVLTRTGGSLRAVADVGEKLERSGLAATRERIGLLADTAPGSTFADALMLGDKPQAFEAAALLTHGEIGGTIALLDARLDMLTALHEALARKLDAREISMRCGVGQFLQRAFRDVAPSYTPARVAACRGILAVADDQWHSGEAEGIPEVICALW
jgi:hypothetical protein